MNTLQQNEEALQDLQPAVGATPFLGLRFDTDGTLIFTTHATMHFREDAIGNLIASDDTAKVLATAARVAGPEIIVYLVN